MELCKTNIVIASAYSALYGGGYIQMVTALASKLEKSYGCTVFFVFPEQTEKEWLTELKNKFHIFFTGKVYDKTTEEFTRLFTEENINLVYTHFEAYDIPVAKAVKKSRRDIKMVWHLHDYQSLDKTGLSFKWLRKVGTNLRMWWQYGYYGGKAYFIGVSAEITNFVTHYRKHIFSFPRSLQNKELENMTFDRAAVIINGISFERLKGQYAHPHNNCFLTFGGESYGKGISTILDAAEILYKEGVEITIMMTKGYTTQDLLMHRYGDKIPKWLTVVEQREDISALFDEAMCYISASLRETMSMAIAEASIYGLPVIQSDIPGTYWNSKAPSTLLFPVNDAHALARRIKQIINADKEELRKKCEETSAYNKKMLSMDNWCNKVIRVFLDL